MRGVTDITKLFPKIKTNYTRLQAGALYAKVSAERQARTYTVDLIQISDMGMILDFQKKNGYVQYISPQIEYQARIQKQSGRLLDLGRYRTLPDLPLTPTSPLPRTRRKPGGAMNPKWKDSITVKLSTWVCSMSPGSSCASCTAPITGRSSVS